ncbi:MAG: hypothetical protein ACHQEB_00145 [Chitinophagales bacterium]
MKMYSTIKRITLVSVITTVFCSVANTQDQSKAPGKNEDVIELSYYKKADLTKTVIALITAKNKEEKFVPVNNVKVNFYSIHNKEQQLLETANTNNKGQAIIVLKKDLPLDDSLYFTIMAKIENDSLYENAQEQMHYKDAALILSLTPRDTTRLLTAIVTEMSKDGKEIPAKNAEVKFYVQRLFGIMPASEDNAISTDEKGQASFAFPKNIPGDTAGVITVVARMEDNKKFGNVENKAPETWGTALIMDKDPFPRALWEPYAPLPLVITISMLFGGVWLVYFFIFYQLRKIKKEKQVTTINE